MLIHVEYIKSVVSSRLVARRHAGKASVLQIWRSRVTRGRDRTSPSSEDLRNTEHSGRLPLNCYSNY